MNSYTLALLRRLYNVGYGWTVLGHYKEVDITDPGSRDTVTVLRPLINEGIKGGITRDAQYVMRIRQEVTKEQVMKKTKGGMEIPDTRSVFSVKLALTSPMSKDTMTMLVKDRLGQFLPEEVDITGDDGFGVWKGAYDAACVEAEKVTG